MDIPIDLSVCRYISEFIVINSGTDLNLPISKSNVTEVGVEALHYSDPNMRDLLCVDLCERNFPNMAKTWKIC